MISVEKQGQSLVARLFVLTSLNYAGQQATALHEGSEPFHSLHHSHGTIMNKFILALLLVGSMIVTSCDSKTAAPTSTDAVQANAQEQTKLTLLSGDWKLEGGDTYLMIASANINKCVVSGKNTQVYSGNFIGDGNMVQWNTPGAVEPSTLTYNSQEGTLNLSNPFDPAGVNYHRVKKAASSCYVIIPPKG